MVWLYGVFVLLISFGRYCGASTLHQDPTPELLNIQRVQIAYAKAGMLGGGFIFIAGVAWVIIRRRGRSGS